MGSTITVTSYTVVDEWEDRIKTAHREMVEKSVPAMLEFAKEVAAFKADCEKKQGGTDFSHKVQEWLTVSQETASMWALIGEKLLAVPITSLPASMDTLYRLSTLPPKKLETAITKGEVHPSMSRADARKLCSKSKKKVEKVEKVPTYEDLEWEIEQLAVYIKKHFSPKDQKSLTRKFVGEMS